MYEEQTQKQTMLAVRTAFLLCLAVQSGSYVSCEQPGGSVMFQLHACQVLLSLGCWITKFCFCTYGSAFMKPSKWLHNKRRYCKLAGQCSCKYRGRHFTVQGAFTKSATRVFTQRCNPNPLEVYGRLPRQGEAVGSYSASYPIPLCQVMALGCVAALQTPAEGRSLFSRRHDARLDATSPLEDAMTGRRAWHENPEWVYDICESLRFRELFRYRFGRMVTSIVWNAGCTKVG